MKWVIKGADAKTGAEMSIEHEARTKEEAEAFAAYNSIFVESVEEQTGPTVPYASAPSPPLKPASDSELQNQDAAQAFATVTRDIETLGKILRQRAQKWFMPKLPAITAWTGAIVAVVLLVSLIIWAASRPQPLPSVAATTPIATPSPAATPLFIAPSFSGLGVSRYAALYGLSVSSSEEGTTAQGDPHFVAQLRPPHGQVILIGPVADLRSASIQVEITPDRGSVDLAFQTCGQLCCNLAPETTADQFRRWLTLEMGIFAHDFTHTGVTIVGNKRIGVSGIPIDSGVMMCVTVERI